MTTTRIKLIYILVASCFVMSHSLRAQKVETTDVQLRDSVIQKIDSLQQVVSALDATLKETTDDLRDQKIWKDRAKYLNIAYANQSLTWEDVNGTWKSRLAVGLTLGKTFYLHKKPLFGMVKFGIDWSYLDLNFGMYENKYSLPDMSYGNGHYYYPGGGDNDSSDEEYEDDSDDWYQVELGMQVGPSVTVNPVDHLKVSAYFRYAPCASILYMNEEVSANYASFFVCGGAVSYKAISIGIEGRWGSAKYNTLIDINDEEGGKEKIKWKTGATRFYISLRY